MTVISSETDVDNLTLVIVAEFEAGVERVWETWKDPRKLERWWGPPTFPATFTRHEFVEGGESRYYMTGPNGENPHGWWRIDVIEPPRRIAFVNGLAGDDGEPVPGVEPMPSHVTFEPAGDRTRMTAVTRFVTVEQMEQMLAMGMQEGMTQAIDQIDAVLQLVSAT
jgi:uncharacterized protein YndB with AHSA1/START domain